MATDHSGVIRLLRRWLSGQRIFSPGALLGLLLFGGGPANAAQIDPSVGVFGLRWGSTGEEVRKAYPADPQLGQDPRLPVFAGQLRFGPVSLPDSAAVFMLDKRGKLHAVVVTTEARPAPALRDALQGALGTPRHAASKLGARQQHVFEWSTARYGVRLQYATSDASGTRGAEGMLQFEVQNVPLSRSQVDAVHEAAARRARFEQQEAAQELASRNVRERENAQATVAFRQGLTPQQAAQCRIPGLVLPADFTVFVAGGYRGVEQDFQIDDSGSAAGLFRVDVNYTAKPVVLMLGAYNPSVWQLRWTQGTRLVAVVLSGHHRQEIVGVPADLPQLTTTRANRGSCGSFYPGQDGQEFINPMARKLFGRPAEMIWPAKDGHVLVGNPIPANARLVSATGPSVDSFADRSKPPAGPAGIDAAVKRGVLRPATRADIEAWRSAALLKRPPDVPAVAGAKAPRVPMPIDGKSYIIVRPFDVPPALSGGNLVTFILPEGVPFPRGDLGHSAVFDMSTGQCSGVTCGMF